MESGRSSDARDAADGAGVRRWTAIRDAAEAVLAQPVDARSEVLDRVCGSDAELRAEVEAQVRACERAAGAPAFLEGSAAAFAAPLLADDGSQLPITDAVPATSGAQRVRSDDLEGALRRALAGRYDIEREIGRGGAATVYLARDHRHGRLVALKVLDPSFGAAMSAARFLREIRVTAALTHPHILPLHDSGEADGLLYYVMPYVEGETLRERLARDGPPDLDAALRIVREVASALAYAHRHGVIHRDIKPANILLEDGHAVVADFGIARAVRRARETHEPAGSHEGDSLHGVDQGGDAGNTLTAGGVSPGTPAYMAPEQARGGSDVDHRADVYALGVVAYELLSGSHPFGTRKRDEIIAAHRDEPPPPLVASGRAVPPALAALVMQCLDKDPQRRPQSAAEIVNVVDALRQGARVGTDVPLRKRTVTLLAGAAVVLLATAGILVRSVRTDRKGVEARSAAVASDTRVPLDIRTVAVMPFVNLGGAREDDYLGDGLTDELAHALGQIPGLRLAGRASTHALKGRADPPQQVGRLLNVGALVTGTVRRAGDRVRVTAQLVTTSDGAVMWDSVYESRSRDAFELQDELTRSIVTALRPTLGEHAPARGSLNATRGTTDQEAYELYLKGRYHWFQRGAPNLARSIVYFRQAIERDPTFARAHAGLALAYAILPIFAAGSADSATALTTASAQRALALDSTLADAHVALGIALEMRLQFREGLSHYRTAVALEPASATAHHVLGVSLLNLGYTDEALVHLGRATQLDPLATAPASAEATGLLYSRRFAEAEAAAGRALALDSTYVWANWTRGLAQAMGGRPDSAVRTLERATQRQPSDARLASALLFAYARAGRWGDAERVRSRLHRTAGEITDGTEDAFAELVFGNREQLVRVLTSRAGQRRYIAAGGVFGCNPLFDPLWSDARFQSAMRALAVKTCRS
jgi:serine/threonine-protein kinase